MKPRCLPDTRNRSRIREKAAFGLQLPEVFLYPCAPKNVRSTPLLAMRCSILAFLLGALAVKGEDLRQEVEELKLQVIAQRELYEDSCQATQ